MGLLVRLVADTYHGKFFIHDGQITGWGCNFFGRLLFSVSLFGIFGLSFWCFLFFFSGLCNGISIHAIGLGDGFRIHTVGLRSFGIHSISTIGTSHIGDGSCGRISRSIFVLRTVVEAFEIESKLQRDELITRRTSEFDHGEFAAGCSLVLTEDFAILCDISTKSRSVSIGLSRNLISVSTSLVASCIKLDCCQ